MLTPYKTTGASPIVAMVEKGIAKGDLIRAPNTLWREEDREMTATRRSSSPLPSKKLFHCELMMHSVYDICKSHRIMLPWRIYLKKFKEIDPNLWSAWDRQMKHLAYLATVNNFPFPRIINCSWGDRKQATFLKKNPYIFDLLEQNTLITHAAGNDFNSKDFDTKLYGEELDLCLEVNKNAKGIIVYFGAYDPYQMSVLDYSCRPDTDARGKYFIYLSAVIIADKKLSINGGTSTASARGAGIAAKLQGLFPELSAREIGWCLLYGATKEIDLDGITIKLNDLEHSRGLGHFDNAHTLAKKLKSWKKTKTLHRLPLAFDNLNFKPKPLKMKLQNIAFLLSNDKLRVAYRENLFASLIKHEALKEKLVPLFKAVLKRSIFHSLKLKIQKFLGESTSKT